MKKIFYWSPHIDPQIATVKSVTNTISFLVKYYKSLDINLINVFGEWDKFENQNIKKINLITHRNLIKKKFKGFLNSRLLYLQIFFESYFLLKKKLKKERPNFIIIHLITIIPIVLFLFNNFQTQLILRISGLPKQNIFRFFLWKIASKKVSKIICPTQQTKKFLIEKNIFPSEKIFTVPDPIIEVKKINFLKKKPIKENFKKPYFLTIGRFTKQKNHFFLINFFSKNKNYLEKHNLIIIGDGELKVKYQKKIQESGLQNYIQILDYKKNVFNYIKSAKCVISSSLWEDPGFIMIEAASVNTPIITSDCPNGPKEFIDQNKCGFLYASNNEQSFKISLDEFLNMSEKDLSIKLFNAKKKTKFYTCFYNSLKLNDIINK